MFYIVATPIGNIQDISLRAVKTLLSADYILAEDTRTFESFYKNIQALFNIASEKQHIVIHFHKENEFDQLPKVLALLKEGKDVALVSESGMPLICDPGSLLLRYIIKEGLSYTVIPGPTAFVNSLILSGFSTKHVLFLGFLPKKQFALVRLLNHLKTAFKIFGALTVVFYESPHRIENVLILLDTIFPDAILCATREMTKKFEQVTRGKAKDLLKQKYKGEITVSVELAVKERM